MVKEHDSVQKEGASFMKPLSEIQRRIYACIEHHLKNEHVPPTIREIGKMLGIDSTAHVKYHLDRLEEKGWIERLPGKNRGIRLKKSPEELPVRGVIAAGLPLDIAPDALSESSLPLSWMQGDKSYALLVRGESMIDACICDGDYIIVQQMDTYRNGEIVVATHLEGGSCGSATVKRIYVEAEQKRVRLQPENRQMEPQYVSLEEWKREWEIQGKVIAVLRQYAPN